MRNEKITMIVLVAIIAIIICPTICGNAYASSSSANLEASADVYSNRLELSDFDPFSEGVYYLRGSGYLEATFSDGLSLTLYSDIERTYRLAVLITGVDQLLYGKTIRFVIGDETLDVTLDNSGNGSIVSTKTYTPTSAGLELKMAITLPAFEGDMVESYDAGTISFVMVRTDSEAIDGSKAIADSNIVSVSIKEIKTGGDVQEIISDLNGSQTTETGEPCIRGNGTDNTEYKIIPDSSSSNPTVLISYDGVKDESIAQSGKNFDLIIKVPAHIKFYLQVDLYWALLGDNTLKVSIENTTMETTISNTGTVYVYNKTYTDGVTTAIKSDKNFNPSSGNGWIITGDHEVEIHITGHRGVNILYEKELELRLVMKNLPNSQQ